MKNILINFLKIIFRLIVLLFFILKFLICLLLSMFIVYFNFIVFTMSFEKYNWQIILYALFSIFAFCSIWFAIFAKFEIKKRFALVFVFIIWIFIPKILPNVMYQFDSDFCLDSGICKEGIINMQDTKGKSIPINKENCINNGYKWIEKYKSCDLRKSR